MKAVPFYNHGPISVLKYQEDFPEPVSKTGRLIIDLQYCGLNHLDIWTRKGVKGKRIKLPHICGCDIVGHVNSESGQFKKGERVMVYPGIGCNRCLMCKTGKENLCLNFSILGGLSNHHGGYAQKVSVPLSNVIRIPDLLDSKTAATLAVSYLTAFNMINATGLHKGHKLLVYGGTGGLGMAVIQIAKSFGIEVITTVSGNLKAKTALRLGADYVIDRAKNDIVEKVQEITNKKGVDVVIDNVGGNTWISSIMAARTGGKIAVCAVTGGDEADHIPIRTFYSKQITMLGSLMGTKSELLKVIDLAVDGKIQPIIDSIYPLKNVRDAQKKLENGEHKGKILLKI